MLTEIIQSPAASAALNGTVAVGALAAALVISSAVRLNKGARVNAAFVVLAFGFVLAAVAAAIRALAGFAPPSITSWGDAAMALAQALMLLGLAWWRAVIKRLTKKVVKDSK